MTDTPPPIAERDHRPAYPIAELREHPRNPNQGDVGALAALIRRHGFRGAIEVQRSTGFIIAGNHRFKAARSLGMTHVPVDLVDVDDREALERLLADNRSRDLAAYDDGALADLLAELGQDGSGQGLVGTGFDGDDLDELLVRLGSDLSLGTMSFGGRTPAERASDYAASAVRSIILPMTLDDYEAAVAALARLRRAWSMDSNADVVSRLLAEADPGGDDDERADG